MRVGVEPDDAMHGIEGLKHMASAVVPPIFEPELAHRRIGVATEVAQDMARRLAREEGLLVGLSSGAALVGALRAAEEMGGGTAGRSSPTGASATSPTASGTTRPDRGHPAEFQAPSTIAAVRPRT